MTDITKVFFRIKGCVRWKYYTRQIPRWLALRRPQEVLAEESQQFLDSQHRRTIPLRTGLA